MTDSLIQARRQFLRKAMGFSFVVTAATSGSLLPALVKAMGKIPDELVPGKSIYEMRGRVWVDGERANEDTVIKANSLVETGARSYVVFVIGTDAHVLRDNSRVQFGGEGFVEESLRVVTGKLLSVFGQRETGSVNMQTSTATIGIRGTGVYAESESESSYFCTCYGLVEIASSRDPSQKEQIFAEHHDAPRYILNDPDKGKLIVPAPMKNHTDEELMLIEALVGREPPFSTLQSYTAPRKGY